jgi:hypothetical protein
VICSLSIPAREPPPSLGVGCCKEWALQRLAVPLQEAGSAGVDTIWSLQYMVPGTLCGAAGPIMEVPVAELQKAQQQHAAGSFP